MSWLNELKKTYDTNIHEIGREQRDEKGDLLYVLSPICHTTQNAHIEIILNTDGQFRRAYLIEQKGQRQTILPATEKAAGRSGSLLAPLALGDKLQYVAKNYHRYRDTKKPGFDKYLARVKRWAESRQSTQEIRAVHQYVQSGTIIKDLICSGILFYDNANDTLPKKCKKEKESSAIFSVVGGDQLDALVRFSVEISGKPNSHLWTNSEIWNSWISYYLENKILEDNFDIDKEKERYPDNKTVFCYAEGRSQQFAATHPAKIRHAGDGAKLISSNDSSGFTYRGRFLNDEQACSIGYETSQKAHNALRWLIAKQGYKAGALAIIAWAPSGIIIPSLVENTYAICEESGLFAKDEYATSEVNDDCITDTGDVVARNLIQRLRGYGKTINPRAGVVVMGLDSLTPGRISISYYRELQASVLLKNIVDWHSSYAWEQNFGKEKRFIGTPAPKDIALAAYRVKPDDSLVQYTVERILPCIVDGTIIPKNIVDSVVDAAKKRFAYEPWEWKKILGIACGLYKGYRLKKDKEEYSMALDKNRDSRDYLFGRLLAIADQLEYSALSTSEKRPTKASQLMQRFADRPLDTWRTIELGLDSYKKRLLSENKLTRFNILIQEVMDLFNHDTFNNSPLTGEFLLGFHNQKSDFYKKKDIDSNDNEEE